MKIPFDIEYRPQIESGEYKVETRDGRPARIICWDAKAKDGCSVVALLPIDKSDLNDEAAYQFSKNGTAYTSKSASEDCADLFIITPEPELTEFEKVVASWLETAKDEPITNEMIVDAADNLMFCARQQIIRGAEKKPSKRLPTIEEWRWLINNCEWKWDDARKGQIITARNGNSIFLPADGHRSDTCLCFEGSYGYYWSSFRNTGDPDLAYYVCFNSGDVGWYRGNRCYGRSVRCVSDTPQEGFVDMGNNLFWAEKNVDGLYNYDEAMKLFNS